MATERQIAANRLNAERSTGPKTPGRQSRGEPKRRYPWAAKLWRPAPWRGPRRVLGFQRPRSRLRGSAPGLDECRER